MPTLVNNLRAIRGPVTAVPMVGASGVVVEPDTANNQVIVRADETVLWEATALTDHTTSCNLSEPITNFKQIQVMFQTNNNNTFYYNYPSDTSFMTVYTANGNNTTVWHKYAQFGISNNGSTITRNYCTEYSNSNAPNAGDVIWLYKIVGINRIAG